MFIVKKRKIAGNQNLVRYAFSLLSLFSHFLFLSCSCKSGEWESRPWSFLLERGRGAGARPDREEESLNKAPKNQSAENKVGEKKSDRHSSSRRCRPLVNPSFFSLYKRQKRRRKRRSEGKRKIEDKEKKKKKKPARQLTVSFVCLREEEFGSLFRRLLLLPGGSALEIIQERQGVKRNEKEKKKKKKNYCDVYLDG